MTKHLTNKEEAEKVYLLFHLFSTFNFEFSKRKALICLRLLEIFLRNSWLEDAIFCKFRDGKPSDGY